MSAIGISVAVKSATQPGASELIGASALGQFYDSANPIRLVWVLYVHRQTNHPVTCINLRRGFFVRRGQSKMTEACNRGGLILTGGPDPIHKPPASLRVAGIEHAVTNNFAVKLEGRLPSPTSSPSRRRDHRSLRQECRCCRQH